MEVQQIREGVLDKAQVFQDKMKKIFDKNAKPDDFQQGDLVLKWDTRYEDKGKHKKFDHLWKGPYQVPKKLKEKYLCVIGGKRRLHDRRAC